MTRRIGNNSWSVEVPQAWAITQHLECVTFERSAEGALQVSSATKKTGDVTDAELLEYAESQNKGWGSAARVTCGQFQGFLYQYTDDEMQCNRWFLRHGSTLLFVTYFANARAQLVEWPAVHNILSTLHVGAAA
jgi:hypothetical protein